MSVIEQISRVGASLARAQRLGRTELREFGLRVVPVTIHEALRRAAGSAVVTELGLTGAVEKP